MENCNKSAIKNENGEEEISESKLMSSVVK